METKSSKTSPEELLRAENADLRARLEEAEQTLRAIRSGEVEALGVANSDGPQVFTLQGLDAESNRLRGDILAQVSDAVGMIDNDERITFLNPAIERLYRVKAGEMLGRKLSELYQRRWLKPGDEAVALATLREQGEARWELIHVTHDGRELHVQSSVCLMRDATGNVKGIIAAIRDITERKQAEEAQRRAEQNLRDFVENATVGMHWVGADGIVLWANRTELQLLGYSLEEYIGHHITEFHADEPVIQDILGRLTRDETLGDYEARLRCKDGSIRDVLINSNVLWENGKFVHTRCFTRDITARKQAEEALRESEDRFRAMADNIPQLAWIADVGTEGHVSWFNKVWLDYTGTTIEQMKGSGWKTVHHPDYIEAVAKKFEHHVKEGLDWEDTFPLRGGDGQFRWFLSRMNCIRDETGKTVRIFGTNTDITAQRESDEKLRVAHDSFRHLVEHSPFGVYAVDADFRLVQVSAGAQKAFENVRPLIGRDFGEAMRIIWPEDIASEVIAIFRHVLATGDPHHTPSMVEARADIGAIEAYDWKAERITLPDGRPGVVCHYYDLSERQRYEALLRGNETRMRLATEATAVGIWEWNVLTNTIRWDAQLFRIYGIAPTTDGFVQYSDGSGAVLPEDLPENERILQDTVRRCGQSRREFRIRRRDDGEVRHIEAAETVRTNADGKAEWVVGTNLDVTQKRRTERAVRESEEHLRALTTAMPQLVWTCSREGDCIFQSLQWESLTGQPAAASLGYGWLERVHPDDRERTTEVWKEAVDKRRTYEADYRLRCKDGMYRWFLARAEPLNDPSGEPLHWIGTSTDIHDAKETAEKLRRASAEVSRASRAKDDFLAALSHELRTPLTPVLMTATALAGDPSIPEEARDQLDMMRRNIELEARLIDDLLDLTRITRGKLQITPVVTDVHELLKQTAEIVRSEELGRQVRMEFHLAAARRHVLADPTRLQQVFWNVLKNALKFTAPGGSVTVRTSDGPADWISVSVADNGVGISAAALPHIFMAFEQGDIAGQHRYGGLGLGLAISHAIVEAHGGTFSAASEGPGLGATFTVALATVVAPTPGSPAEARRKAPERGLRLLIVEDHETTRTVLARLLTRHGHQVVTAGSAHEALAVFAAERFDAVISDLGLPDGTGLDLMREMQRQRPVPAIALSGYGTEEDLRQAKEAGFFAHLVKPVNLGQLQQLLDQITPAPR